MANDMLVYIYHSRSSISPLPLTCDLFSEAAAVSDAAVLNAETSGLNVKEHF